MAGTASAGVVSCTPGGNDVFSATLRTRVSYVNGSLGFSRPFPRNIQANPGRCSSSHSLYCPGSLLGWLILTKNDETPRSLPAGCGLKLYVAWERYGAASALAERPRLPPFLLLPARDAASPADASPRAANRAFAPDMVDRTKWVWGAPHAREATSRRCATRSCPRPLAPPLCARVIVVPSEHTMPCVPTYSEYRRTVGLLQEGTRRRVASGVLSREAPRPSWDGPNNLEPSPTSVW